MRLQNRYIGILVFLASVLLWSCSDSSGDGNSQDPSNLVVDFTLTDDNSGSVQITATATNAVEFQFDLGDGSGTQTNTTGLLDYTYQTSGVYTIEIKAYGASDRFVRKSFPVTIIVGDDDPGFTSEGYITPLTYDGMTLVWSDEFSGNGVNQTYWNFETGPWTINNELQYYTDRNAIVSNGFLTIEARREDLGGRQHTSSRITTQNKFNFKFGRVDIRAKLPEGQGIWPALWMLGEDITTVGWPACGEIDIMELVGHEPNKVHGTIHFGPQWPNNKYVGTSYSLTGGAFQNQFNVFTLIWTENKMEWYINDVLYQTRTPADTAGEEYPFNDEFFFIFNVAVGGDWPGSPNASTQFPQQMVVDYVRVFQES